MGGTTHNGDDLGMVYDIGLITLLCIKQENSSLVVYYGLLWFTVWLLLPLSYGLEVHNMNVTTGLFWFESFTHRVWSLSRWLGWWNRDPAVLMDRKNPLPSAPWATSHTAKKKYSDHAFDIWHLLFVFLLPAYFIRVSVGREPDFRLGLQHVNIRISMVFYGFLILIWLWLAPIFRGVCSSPRHLAASVATPARFANTSSKWSFRTPGHARHSVMRWRRAFGACCRNWLWRSKNRRRPGRPFSL